MGTNLSRREAIPAIIAQFQDGIRELRCVGSERMVRLGLSMSHWHIISMLDRHGEMPMSRLADLLDVSMSNATGIVDRMEERGLVERVRVPDDRRLVLVRVTDRGREILSEIEVFRDEMLTRVLDLLDDTQLERLSGALGDLRTAIVDTIGSSPGTPWHDHAHGPHGRHPHTHE